MLPLSEAELDPAVVQVGPPFQYLHLYSLLMCENLTLSREKPNDSIKLDITEQSDRSITPPKDHLIPLPRGQKGRKIAVSLLLALKQFLHPEFFY